MNQRFPLLLVLLPLGIVNATILLIQITYLFYINFFFFSLNLSIYNPIYKRRHLEKALNEGITVSHNGVSNKVGAVEAAASLYCELHKQHLSKQLQ